MPEEDAFLPLSALQPMLFCDRQAALIHLDRIWLDNALTVEGSDLHRVVDDMGSETRGMVIVRRGLSLRSQRLGVTGKAGLVQFHRVPTAAADPGCVLPEMLPQDPTPPARRPPRGGRGLTRFSPLGEWRRPTWSQPARGAWIEQISKNLNP